MFGSFDFLHEGHLHFFESAKRRGSCLVVAVARDVNVAKAKGHAPFFDERERLRMVGALRVVDKAVLGSKKDFFAVVRREKPSVIVLGYDQPANERAIGEKLAALKLKTRIVRLQKGFEPAKNKSSTIRRHLRC